MPQKILLKNSIPVHIHTSTRAKRVRISVALDGSVLAVQPTRVELGKVLAFLESKIEWIEKKVHFFRLHPSAARPRIRHSKKEYAEYRKQAKVLVTDRLAHFNQFYNFKYNKIFIKNQKTRWGSCSNKGNLNFSYKIIFLPTEAQDYLIVHELCHLKEMNHSKQFWNLVTQQVPHYKRIHKTLRHHIQ